MIDGINNIVNYSLENKKIKHPDDKTIDAAQEFSQVMIKQLLDIALKQDETNELFSTGYAGGIFHGMLMDEYSKELSKPGNFGLTEVILSELIKLQEVSND